MNVDKMPAGREMDALVAEKVMGRSICEHSRTSSVAQSGGIAMCGDRACTGELHYEYIPAYSTDIAAAWEVLAELRLRNPKSGRPGYYHTVNFVQGFWSCALAPMSIRADWTISAKQVETAPLAICRAALKAVGL